MDLKISEEQVDAIEMLAEHAVVMYSKAIEESGSVEIAKDILCQYFIALLSGNRSRWKL